MKLNNDPFYPHRRNPRNPRFIVGMLKTEAGEVTYFTSLPWLPHACGLPREASGMSIKRFGQDWRTKQ